jgi:RNA polymerase sigma factor (sigma-70 family)
VAPRLTDVFLRSQSDERLVSLAQAGHERAFAVIVERYRGELQAFARRHNADGRAEDIVQQAFLGAFAALRSGAEIRHLRGWLYRIVRNEAIKTGTPTTDVPLDDVAVCGEPLEDVVQRRAVALSALSELSDLPTRQRQALVATALGGTSRADIARTMGLSEGAVRQLIHRARNTVRTAVTGLTPYPLAQFFAGSGSGAASDAPLAAGAASAGGVAAKFGAVLAAGVVATGIATTQIPHSSHRAPPRASAARDANGHGHGAALVASAATVDSAAGDRLDHGSRHGSDDLGDNRSDGHGEDVARALSGRGPSGSSRGGSESAGRGGPRSGSSSRGGPGADGGAVGDGDQTRSSGSGSGAGRGGSSRSGDGNAGKSDGSGSGSGGGSGKTSGGGSSGSGGGGSSRSGGGGSSGGGSSDSGGGGSTGTSGGGGSGAGRSGSSGSGHGSDGATFSTDGVTDGGSTGSSDGGKSDGGSGAVSTGSDGGSSGGTGGSTGSDGGSTTSQSKSIVTDGGSTSSSGGTGGSESATSGGGSGR